MRQSWGEFLKGACATSHGVQVYEEATDLADSVAAFLAAGFDRDQPGVLVATSEHMTLFADRLDMVQFAHQFHLLDHFHFAQKLHDLEHLLVRQRRTNGHAGHVA